MSVKQSNLWKFAVSVVFMAGGIFAAYVAMSTESAVQGEQIRTMQGDARCLRADGEKHKLRIRKVEREMDGLKPAVQAVGKIAEKNATKLDELLLRGK